MWVIKPQLTNKFFANQYVVMYIIQHLADEDLHDKNKNVVLFCTLKKSLTGMIHNPNPDGHKICWVNLLGCLMTHKICCLHVKETNINSKRLQISDIIGKGLSAKE
jgi:hypothetical protein